MWLMIAKPKDGLWTTATYGCYGMFCQIGLWATAAFGCNGMSYRDGLWTTAAYGC